MIEFLSFRKFYTPVAIHILFWIGVGACVVEGITMIASAGPFGRGLGILNGLLVLLIGPILVRVACELIMAVFGIHESLRGRGD